MTTAKLQNVTYPAFYGWNSAAWNYAWIECNDASRLAVFYMLDVPINRHARELAKDEIKRLTTF